MPPKAAPKEKVAKGDEAEELVASYLKAVNRPYASTDVAANLKNKVPKAAAQKIMLALAEKGTLTKKDYGKQTIFVYNQALLSVLSPEDMAEVDEELKTTQAELDERRKELKALEKAEYSLASKEALPKTKELGKEIDKIKAENDLTSNALQPYRGENGQSTITPLAPEAIKQIDADWIKCRKAWVDRRKIYKQLVGDLGEAGLVSSAAELEEDQGIAIDEDEAIDVENGEFCKPAPIVRRPAPTKSAPLGKISPAAAAAVNIERVDSYKRSATDTPSSQEEVVKKKKAKKA